MNDVSKHAVARATRARLKELEENPLFLALLAEIGKARDRAQAGHEDAASTAEKRSEWLWALKQGRELAAWFDNQKAEADATLKKTDD